MNLGLYKKYIRPDFIKNISLDSVNDHEQKLVYITDSFPRLNQLSYNEITFFYKTIKTFLNETRERDFTILFSFKFHNYLYNYITDESKLYVFIICIDILNKLIKNPDARKITHQFLEPEFVNIIFNEAFFINKQLITIQSQNKTCTKLLKILLKIFKIDLSLFESFQHLSFFEKICKLYETNIDLTTSITILEIIIYILQQNTIVITFEEIEPIFQIAQSYISSMVENIDSFPEEQFSNLQESLMNYAEFSKICLLIIQLAKRNLDYFYESFDIYQFYPLLLYSNQICSCSLIDLLIFILSLPNITYDFANSIEWQIVEDLIDKFNAVESEDPNFIIKTCNLIESLIPYRKIETEQIEDLISFINYGSFKMQIEAIRVTCILFLKKSDILLKLDFQFHLANNVLFAIFNHLESSYSNDFTKLLLSTLLKSTKYFLLNGNADVISTIEDFCYSDSFQNIFDESNSEEIIPFKQAILDMLN